MSSRNSASPQQLSREEEKQGSYGIVMNESLNNNHNDMQSQSSNFGGICSTPIIEELNKLSISKKKLSSSTIDSLSLQSSTGESLPASYCDTDAALFQFADFEMLEDEEDDVDIEMDRNYLHSSKENGNMLSTKRRIQSNGSDHKGKDTDMKGKPKGSEPQDLIKTELILFGIDLSHLSSVQQFFISASGVIGFNMVYGYLQELIQIKIAGRSFAIFLGSCQFLGYAFWSYALAKMRARLLRKRNKTMNVDEVKRLGGEIYASLLTEKGEANVISSKNEDNLSISPSKTKSMGISTSRASWGTYFALSVIRAIDLALTNLSMKYLNYPAKTLIKSSRVIFTMLLGLVIGKKKYKRTDYIMVIMLVVGLALFLHADMHTSAVFHPIGVAMLATSLTLDATVSNWSELIMKKHNLGQDDFQMKLYSFSFLIMLSAAYLMNELWSGIEFFFMSDGTYNEFLSYGGSSSSRTTTSGASEMQLTTAWTRNDKIIAVILFSTLGIFGGSCAAAITKRFGALTMSITTTTRKAATIFLSFAMFNNECTPEHVCGVFIFVSGLLMKGLKNHIKIPRWSLPFPKTFLTRFRVGGGGGMQRSRETAT